MKDNKQTLMMKKLRVMIVSPPGSWQRTIQRKIETHPFVDIVDVASGSLTAAQIAQTQELDLVLIDSSITFDDTLILIKKLNLENPTTRSMVITDTTQQRRRALQAGVDYVTSSFNFESQINDVLDQLSENLQDRTESSEKKSQIFPDS